MSAGRSESRHVALLRGINVGGKNKLPMPTLTKLCAALGCSEAQAYIQSGNIVFGASGKLASQVPGLLAQSLERELGLQVPVIVRSALQLAEIIANNPFLAAGEPAETLHVAFLADAPPAAKLAKLDPKRSTPDAFEVRGHDIYLRLPNGVARTKLNNAYFDSTLGTTSTLRNWRTVCKLAELCSGV